MGPPELLLVKHPTAPSVCVLSAIYCKVLAMRMRLVGGTELGEKERFIFCVFSMESAQI